MISCVGVAPGQKNQLDGNGAVNERIADAAKKAKVGRLVYISVASAISEGTGKLLFADYVKGKQQAEAAASKASGGDGGAGGLGIKRHSVKLHTAKQKAAKKAPAT